MGYDSTFSGSMRPSKPIPPELVARINDKCDLRVMMHVTDDCDGEIGDIVPDARTMHGYDLVKDVFRVQQLLKPHGITLTGEIFRAGESDGDFEKVEAVKGRIYVRSGEITYGKRRPVTAEDVTSYAVRVMKRRKKSQEIVGWLAYKSLLDGSFGRVEPLSEAGKPILDNPLPLAYRFTDAAEATAAADKLNNGKTRKTLSYEVVKMEGKL